MASAALALLGAATAAASPVRVDLDPRLELIGAVSWLGAPKSTSTPDALASLPYARELASRLPAPRDPALTAPLSGAERTRLALSVSPPPALEPLDASPESDAAAQQPRLAALRVYARTSGFAAAFDASRYLLDADAARLREALSSRAPLRALDDYTGLRGPERAAVLLSPFAEPGPSPARVDLRDDGTASLTLVVGPQASTSAPAELAFRSEGLPEVLWNDAAELQLEPLLTLYSARLAQSAKLAGPDARCVADWRRCAGDLLARAVTLRLTARRGGADAAAALRERLEGGARSPVLTALLARLQAYEGSRRGRKGNGLDAAFPEVIAALPLDEPDAAPAAPELPPAGSLSPAKRRRLAAFVKAAAARTGDPRLKELAAAAPAWERAAESAQAPPPR